MNWSQISRFGIFKTSLLKKCRLLLTVYSHECRYSVHWNCIHLPHTISRGWVSLTACSPYAVHGTDKTHAVYGTDKTYAVHGTDKTCAVHGTDKTCAVHGTSKTYAVHGTDKTCAVYGTDKTCTVLGAIRTGETHNSVARGSSNKGNSTYFNLRVMRLSPSPWRNFSTSSKRTDKESQLQNKNTNVTTDSARVDSGRTDLTTETTQNANKSVNEGDDASKKLTLYQRFKKTYKEHGKILIVVHLLTSAVWFGSFYTVAKCGVDVISFMEKLNFSEKIITPFRSGGLGNVAVAYLMYKLATPARYTVTIGGTNLAIRYLRKEGMIPQVPHEDRFRSLYKEGKEHIKSRSRVHMRRLRRKHGHKFRAGHTKDKH